MAAPNLAAVTSIFLKNALGGLSTVRSTLLTCLANKAIKVVSIYAANIDGTVAADATFVLDRGGTDFRIVSTVSVAADATLVPVMKDAPIYLEEGDLIQGDASADNKVHYIISYEEYDDA